MAIRIDGKALAAQCRAETAERVAALRARGITPGLAVVLVGDDPASQIYVRNKEKACAEVGIRSFPVLFPSGTTQEQLLETIDQLNANENVHGILVQLPLPKQIDKNAVLERILPQKDADGFHPIHAGRLLNGEDTVVPCTPRGVLRMLKSAGVPLRGKEAVVVGRSAIVGRPMAALLLREDCTVTICHSRTEDLAAHTRRADILVAACGQPQLITGEMVKPGAAVIDVGIHRVDGHLVGDVDAASVEPVAGWLSPVPGGVGPMTIAMLLQNTVEAAEHALS